MSYYISGHWTYSLELTGGDTVHVYNTGLLENSKPSITSLGSSQKVIVEGSIYSHEGTAVTLGNLSWINISGGTVKGKTGAISIGEMRDGDAIFNTGAVIATEGTAIRGAGYLAVSNGNSVKHGLISGTDFAIDFTSAPSRTGLIVDNYGSIGASTAIRSGDSDDSVTNFQGVIEGKGGVAISLGGGNDTFRGKNGTVLGRIDMGSGQDRIYVGANAETIDGGDDQDTVIFAGRRDDYVVTKGEGGAFRIKDARVEGDIGDTIYGCELFSFNDTVIKAADLIPSSGGGTGGGTGGGGTGGGGTGGGGTGGGGGAGGGTGGGGTGGGAGGPGPSLPQPSNLDKVIFGTRGKDALLGAAGNDKLYGLSGNDVLTGGAGQDVFVFDTALGKGTKKNNHNKKVNYDTITDFNPTDDAIWLDNAVFKKLGKVGSEAAPAKLNAKFFKIGKATDKNDFLIYKNGVVFYDADGNGTKYKPVQIMKFANKAAVTADDFFIV